MSIQSGANNGDSTDSAKDPPVTSAYRHTRPIAATHSITEDTWMAHVGSESALAGSSLTSRPAAAAGLPCDSSAASATAVTTAAVASQLSGRL